MTIRPNCINWLQDLSYNILLKIEGNYGNNSIFKISKLAVI